MFVVFSAKRKVEIRRIYSRECVSNPISHRKVSLETKISHQRERRRQGHGATSRPQEACQCRDVIHDLDPWRSRTRRIGCGHGGWQHGAVDTESVAPYGGGHNDVQWSKCSSPADSVGRPLQRRNSRESRLRPHIPETPAAMATSSRSGLSPSRSVLPPHKATSTTYASIRCHLRLATAALPAAAPLLMMATHAYTETESCHTQGSRLTKRKMTTFALHRDADSRRKK
jgi:hypothetical protein